MTFPELVTYLRESILDHHKVIDYRRIYLCAYDALDVKIRV